MIHFVLPGGRTDDAPIEQAVKDHLYVVRLFGERLTFSLAPDEARGTDLTLSHEGHPYPVPWVSLLLRLKAHVDFGADLRNHDPDRGRGYVDGC